MATAEKKKAEKKGPAPAEVKKAAQAAEPKEGELNADELDKVSGGGNKRIWTLNQQTQDET